MKFLAANLLSGLVKFSGNSLFFNNWSFVRVGVSALRFQAGNVVRSHVWVKVGVLEILAFHKH